MNYLQICVIILLSLASEVFCSCKEEYKTFSGTHTACLEPNKSCKTIRVRAQYISVISIFEFALLLYVTFIM